MTDDQADTSGPASDLAEVTTLADVGEDIDVGAAVSAEDIAADRVNDNDLLEAQPTAGAGVDDQTAETG